MEKVRYMISDASNLIRVESHVLRYWEEELELDIPRNEMGHRYYTEENIRQFEQIKKLKDEGYQLKAIKMLVHSMEGREHLPIEEQTEIVQVEPLSKLEQFQQMMIEIVRSAIAENNQALGQAVGEQVGQQVLKEMNYLMREREEQEEERFRKLDETIRNHQKKRRNILSKKKKLKKNKDYFLRSIHKTAEMR